MCVVMSSENVKTHAIFNRSTIIIVLIGVTSMVEYSMVMPSLATYITDLHGTHILYGVAVGLFSFSRLLSMPLLGNWSDKRPMIEPLVFSILISALGNLLYGLAQCMSNFETQLLI